MRAVMLACVGYGFGMTHDLASLRGWPAVKPWLWGAMMGSHLLSHYRLAAKSPRMPVPRAPHRLCWLLWPVAFAAFLYSIFIEIPLRKAWIRRGHTDELVTDGSYALTRHPGVLLYSLAVITFALATRSLRLLLASPVLIAGDVVHVWFQERFVLGTVFPGSYDRYRQHTPMLVPTAASARRFLGQFAPSAGTHHDEGPRDPAGNGASPAAGAPAPPATAPPTATE